MVVGDFDVVGMVALPSEADAVRCVHPDAELSRAISPKPLQPIPGRGGEFPEILNPVELVQLPPHHRPEGSGAGSSCLGTVDPVKQLLRGNVSEGAYHGRCYNEWRDRATAP